MDPNQPLICGGGGGVWGGGCVGRRRRRVKRHQWITVVSVMCSSFYLIDLECVSQEVTSAQIRESAIKPIRT